MEARLNQNPPKSHSQILPLTPPPPKKIPLLNFVACELTTAKGIPFDDKSRCVMNTMAKFSIKWIHVGTLQKYDITCFIKHLV